MGKEPACSAGGRDLIPGLGRSPGGGHVFSSILHSSLFAWAIPWTAEPAGYSPRGCKESDMTERQPHSPPYQASQPPRWERAGHSVQCNEADCCCELGCSMALCNLWTQEPSLGENLLVQIIVWFGRWFEQRETWSKRHKRKDVKWWLCKKGGCGMSVWLSAFSVVQGPGHFRNTKNRSF